MMASGGPQIKLSWHGGIELSAPPHITYMEGKGENSARSVSSDLLKYYSQS